MFRIKDLVVSVLPKVSDIPELRKCLLGTHICIRPTVVCQRLISCGIISPYTCHVLSPVTCRQFSPCQNFTCGYFSPCQNFTCGNFSPCQNFTCGNFSPCQNFTCGILSGCQQFTPPCPLHSVDCQFGTRGCPGPSVFDDDPVTMVINPQVLVVNEVADIKLLREQLAQVEKALGEYEKKGLDFDTQTPEELAELESKLKEALEEVQARRKQSGGSGSKR